MIDIPNVWVPQMLGYCELIADDERLALAFDQKPGELWTSVTDYDELIEQVFDDLDALGMLEVLAKSQLDSELMLSLELFVRRLAEFDEGKGQAEFDRQSSGWLSVKSAALKAISASKNLEARNAQTH